jgi:hypothetical protein
MASWDWAILIYVLPAVAAEGVDWVSWHEAPRMAVGAAPSHKHMQKGYIGALDQGTTSTRFVMRRNRPNTIHDHHFGQYNSSPMMIAEQTKHRVR